MNYYSKLTELESSQNYILIWLDHDIDASKSYYHSLISQLQNVIYSIFTFNDPDQCVDFITDINEQQIFMIISSSLAQQVISLIQDRAQIDSIYIFSHSSKEGKLWSEQWIKFKGIFNEIDELCNRIKRDTHRCDYNMASISIMPTTNSLDRDIDELDQSFMHSQLLKNILLDMEYDQHSKKEMVDFFRKQYHGVTAQLKIVDEIDQEYDKHTPIWWYTRDSFLYSMLNRALRTQDVETIIKMGFFLKDVHQEIQTIYRNTWKNDASFIVYRGQGMFKNDIENLKMSQNGLLAFNNFLSTSMDHGVSLMYAESSAQSSDLDGVLFEINVNPANTSNPFALVENISYFGDVEKEILFSMHTIFRIGEMKQLDGGILQIKLTLTNDNDQQLRVLTEHFEKELSGDVEWGRLARFMINFGKFDKAEDIYRQIDNLTSEKYSTNVAFHLNIGNIKCHKGEYENALLHFNIAHDLVKQYKSPNYFEICSVYNYLGLVYEIMGKYDLALTFYQQAVEIQQKYCSSQANSLNSTYHNMGLNSTYHNMGNLYRRMGDYINALSFYKKSLEIGETYFPNNHPRLSNTYNQIGETYRNLGHYSIAMSYFQRTLEIRQKIFPPNHPSFAVIYHNIATGHASMHDYSNALCFYQKALEIEEKALGSSHPDVGSTYNGMVFVYNQLGEHSTALSYGQKALQILEHVLPYENPDLATLINNIAFAYQGLQDHKTALVYYQKTLDIQKKTLSSNHTDLARTYNNIGCCKLDMEEYTNAISCFEKALHMRHESLPSNHPSLAWIYEPMATAYGKIGDYSKALWSLTKAQKILEITPFSNDQILADIYNRIGLTHSKMGNVTDALSFYRKALDIIDRILSANDVNVTDTQENSNVLKNCQKFSAQISMKQAVVYKNMGNEYRQMKDYSNALGFFEKALKIEQTSICSNDYELSVTYNSISFLYLVRQEYSTALPFAQKTL